MSVLIVPGLKNSGAAHWQSLWQLKRPEYVRVLQRDWSRPGLDEWAVTVDGAIRKAKGRAILVAHSYGCLAVLRRLRESADAVAGAMLVAPADPELFNEAISSVRLPFPAVVLASRNDHWFAFDKAKALAARLGASFVDLGKAGHVNAESGYGPWPEGERVLEALRVQAVRKEKLERQLAFAAAL